MIKQQQAGQTEKDANNRQDFDTEVLDKLIPLKIENDRIIPSGKRMRLYSGLKDRKQTIFFI